MLAQLYCPLSKKIFHEPVVGSDGQLYEEQEIKKIIKSQIISPITKEHVNYYCKCHVMKRIVKDYIKKNPDLSNQVYNPILISNDYSYIMNNLLSYSKVSLCDLNRENMVKLLESSPNRFLFELIDKIDDLEYVYTNGLRLIHHVIKYSTDEVVKYLLTKNINLECETIKKSKPIHFVCRYKLHLLKYFIKFNVNLECADSRQWRPIHYVCRSGTPELIKYMIDLGLNLECENNNKSRPIHLVCINSTPKIIKYMIDQGVNLECSNSAGNKPIHILCRFGSVELIEYIINKNVDLKSKTIDDKHPYEWISKDKFELLSSNAQKKLKLA